MTSNGERKRPIWKWVRWLPVALSVASIIYLLVGYVPAELARRNANASVESAWISAVAGFLGVVATAAVAVAAFWYSRATNRATIKAAETTTNKTVKAALDTNKATIDAAREAQFPERYGKAIEQLGSDNRNVRIGGIYALERIADDSPRDHATVMEVLAACVRELSGQPSGGRSGEPEPVPRPDIQAAVTVIGRRDATHDRRRINLRGVHLPWADLGEANLSGADLSNANLAGADLTEAGLTGADLTGAQLDHANLTGAKLHKANLTGAALRANLTGANLTEAKFLNAYLTDADLTGTDLTGADLRGANLTGANLTGANLSSARLTGANLTGANLSSARLTGANLSGANLIGAKLTEADLTATERDMSDPFSDEAEEVKEVEYVRVRLADADLTGAESPARTLPTRSSLARTSPALGGQQISPFRRAGNWIRPLAD